MLSIDKLTPMIIGRKFFFRPLSFEIGVGCTTKPTTINDKKLGADWSEPEEKREVPIDRPKNIDYWSSGGGALP